MASNSLTNTRQKNRWPFSYTTNRGSNLFTPEVSNSKKPQYLRLDSAGENTIEEDIPTVFATRNDMARSTHHHSEQSLLGPAPHINKPNLGGFHQNMTSMYNESAPNYYFVNSAPSTRNFPGQNYAAVPPPSFMGVGGRYFPPGNQNQYSCQGAPPFQFGAGHDYRFNPNLYPWNMCTANFEPAMMRNNITPHVYYGASIPTTGRSCQNQFPKQYAYQNSQHPRQHHNKRHKPQWRGNQSGVNCHKPKSVMSCVQSKDLEPKVAAGNVASAGSLAHLNESRETDSTVGAAVQLNDITNDIRALDISSDCPADTTVSMSPCKSDSEDPCLADIIMEPISNISASNQEETTVGKPPSKVAPEKTKNCDMNTPPLTKKYATISVKKFFPNRTAPEIDTENHAIKKCSDKKTENCEPVKVTSVDKCREHSHLNGFHSELDLIKDTYLPSDTSNCHADQRETLYPCANYANSANGKKPNNIKSFRIQAFVSSSNVSCGDQSGLTDAVAGVHGSPPVQCASSSQEFNAQIFVTPKTDCLAGARRKKTRSGRPSAKKRQRKKAQRSENQTQPEADEAHKKQKTERSRDVKSPAISVPKSKKFSFYVDVSDSQDDSEAATGTKSSPDLKSSPQSPCFSKFSFVIHSSEFSSDSEEDSDSEDDGFDESDEGDQDFNSDLWNSFSKDQSLLNFDIHCSFSPMVCGEPCSSEATSLPSPSCVAPESQNPQRVTPESPEPSCLDLQKSVEEANLKWNRLYATPDCDLVQAETPKKVLFANTADLATVHMEEEDMGDEYQAARKGPWEEYARDRCRFRSRVEHFETLLLPYIQPEHREMVYHKYHSE